MVQTTKENARHARLIAVCSRYAEDLHWRATDARPFVIFTIVLVPPMVNVLTQLGDVGKNGLISHVQLVVDLH